MDDNRPVISPVEKQTITHGKTFNLIISAESPLDNELTYAATQLPRGAIFDPETRMITWKPDSYQIGNHVIQVVVSDGALNSSVYFNVEVVYSVRTQRTERNRLNR